MEGLLAEEEGESNGEREAADGPEGRREDVEGHSEDAEAEAHHEGQEVVCAVVSVEENEHGDVDENEEVEDEAFTSTKTADNELST